MQRITILIHCEDKKAIVASVTNYIASIDGNITYLDQHVDADENVFFMRLECEFSRADWDIDSIKTHFQENLATPFNMNWQMYTQEQKPKMGLFISKTKKRSGIKMRSNASGAW